MRALALMLVLVALAASEPARLLAMLADLIGRMHLFG